MSEYLPHNEEIGVEAELIFKELAIFNNLHASISAGEYYNLINKDYMEEAAAKHFEVFSQDLRQGMEAVGLSPSDAKKRQSLNFKNRKELNDEDIIWLRGYLEKVRALYEILSPKYADNEMGVVKD
jgi:tRNA C32,U32 (ribose-2'-O)-methylase TrmJ